ncbi:MAG: ASKHA domain-containing protein [Thermodesulfobacteriota bacterium]|nr:ASKHA domain-containing protein [Thermodesulfobacteriota bacterium]
MGKCVNHPDRETNYVCLKHGTYMCEECLKCRDPDLYCKFRSSCPIWFMTKHSDGLDDVGAEEKKECTVTFQPDNQRVTLAAGSTLLDAARAGEIPLNASCNGKGSCGKCKLVAVSGKVDHPPTPLLTDEEKKNGYVLACQAKLSGDVTVRIPEETLEKKLQVAGMGAEVTDRLKGLVTDITPMRESVALELAPPTLDDAVSDLDRLNRGLKQQGYDLDRMNMGLRVMRDMASVMRSQNFHVTAHVLKKRCSNEVVGLNAGNAAGPGLGLAIDVGTTSIVVYLVDMTDGTVIAATAGHNRQAACGDDVINRIVCSEKDGVKKLRTMALATINGLLNEALFAAGRDRREVTNIALAGNTVMTHLLLGIEPRNIRREPYVPTVSAFPILKAVEVGIKADPDAAVFIMPGPAGYVGGDIVSGLIYTGFHREEAMTLFIDVGTNGEIVLGNNQWLLTASCSAGPAFEGGGVRWGMRAEEGAIEKVTIDTDTLVPSFSVVGDKPARGICGSGMIDLISEMLMTGVIQANGRFALDADHPRMTVTGDEKAFVVAMAGQTAVGQDIVFTESDINTIIRSKGAVYAGFTVLLRQAGIDFAMLDQVIITGGFGQFLNIEKAITIGLLPDIDRAKFKYMGNSSVAGAYMALLSEKHRKEAIRVSNSMTYVDFSSNNEFMSEFTSALFLPHTNLEDFPSVKWKKNSPK